MPEIDIFCMFSAQEKEVTIKDPRTGKNQVVVVKVWNETVANLTLMALGSSAPEIMLSVIEIWAKGFEVSLIHFYLIWSIWIHFDPIWSNLIKKFKSCKVTNETIENLILME